LVNEAKVGRGLQLVSQAILHWPYTYVVECRSVGRVDILQEVAGNSAVLDVRGSSKAGETAHKERQSDSDHVEKLFENVGESKAGGNKLFQQLTIA
jgi:hypothetical protein